MNKIVVTATLMLTACSVPDNQALPSAGYEIRQAKLATYGIMPNDGPVLFVLATDIQNTLDGASTIDPLATSFYNAGYTVVSLDLPCHGADGDTNTGLTCWRARIEAGQDIFTPFGAKLSSVIDDLGPRRVGIVGISRGCYAALKCAALDPRITAMTLIAPLTDLARLSEFAGMPSAPAPQVLNRNILVRVNQNDDRIGSDEAIAYAQAVNATLQVIPGDGHYVPEDGSTLTWLSANFRF